MPEIAAAVDGFLLKPFDLEALHILLDRRSSAADLLLLTHELVLNAEILAQFRKLMPEPAVRQIYTAVVADLSKRLKLSGRNAKGDTAEVRRIVMPSRGCGMAGALQAAHLGRAPLESTLTRSQDNQLDNSAAVLHDEAAAQGLERMLEADLRSLDPSHLQTTWFASRGNSQDGKTNSNRARGRPPSSPHRRTQHAHRNERGRR